MAAGTYWSLVDRVARYLLLATVGLLAVDAGVDTGLGPTLRWSTLVLAATFASLAVVAGVTRRHPGWRAGSPFAAGVADRRVVLLAVAAVVAMGAVLRGYALGVQNFWFDEAITANAAVALLERGQPTFPSGHTYWRGFPHTLVVAGSMALFGTGEAAARLPSVVFGVATIPVTYWLGRQVGGRSVGLVAATLVTFATWEIAWSRQARMYQLFQLLYTLSLVLLVRVERRGFGDRGAVVALVGVGTLAALTHPIGYVLLPVAVAYLGSAAALDGRLDRQTAGGLLVGSLAFVLVSELLGSGPTDALASVASTDVDYLGAYVGWLVSELGAVSYLGAVGGGLTFYRGWYRRGALLVLAVVPATWVLAFHTELFATRYLYFGLPVLFVWAAVTVTYVAGEAAGWFESARTWWRERDSSEPRTGPAGGRASFQQVTAVALGIVVLLATGGGFTVAPQAEYELGVNAPQPDFERAYAYVNEHRAPGDVIVAGWTAPGLYYAGGVDYWLAHDLTGSGERWTVNGVDRYAGAEPIRTAEGLRAVVRSHDRGWIVIDSITRRQWRAGGADISELIPELTAVTVIDDSGDSITVYAWGYDGLAAVDVAVEYIETNRGSILCPARPSRELRIS